MTLTEFLLARIAEDEAMARAAIDADRPGTHWQWVTNETDTPVKTGDLAEAQNYQSVSLRTVEKYPTMSGLGPLPAFIISHTEEVEAAGDHITRWDPARVLAECEAKRRIVEEWQQSAAMQGDDGQPLVWTYAPHRVLIQMTERWLRYFAAPHADHPDCLPEWKP